MFIKSTLTLSQKICEYMSCLQTNRSRMGSGKINVTERENVQRLICKKFCESKKKTHI